MNRIPYTNNTTRIQHIGSAMVMPGDTRMVDPSLVGTAPPVDKPEPVDQLLALLDNNVSDVKSEFERLSDDELLRLKEAEEGGKTRVSLMQAFDEEFVRRAEIATDSDTGE